MYTKHKQRFTISLQNYISQLLCFQSKERSLVNSGAITLIFCVIFHCTRLNSFTKSIYFSAYIVIHVSLKIIFFSFALLAFPSRTCLNSIVLTLLMTIKHV